MLIVVAQFHADSRCSLQLFKARSQNIDCDEMNTFIRQRVAADKYNIQLVIHTRQHMQVIYTR